MRTLSRTEIAKIVQEGKAMSEKDGTAVLNEFERDQPLLYLAIFGTLSDGIAESNVDMSNLFLDLCFDIILVYKKSFGNPPAIQQRGEAWFEKKLSLLDAELKSIADDAEMSPKLRERLSSRFIERSVKAGVQTELFHYLDEEVNKYASFKKARKKAIHVTMNMLFVVVRLMDDIYSPED